MCVVLAVLESINYIALLMPGCFVLSMDKFLLVGRCEVNRDMMKKQHLYVIYMCVQHHTYTLHLP